MVMPVRSFFFLGVRETGLRVRGLCSDTGDDLKMKHSRGRLRRKLLQATEGV